MMRILLAGAAAIALAASGAYAQPGKNGDNGNGPGNGKHNNAAKVERGPPDRGPQRPGNNGNKDARPDKRVAQQPDRRDARQNVPREIERRVSQRPQERAVERRVDRRDDRRDLSQRAERRIERSVERRVDRRDGRRDVRRGDRNLINYVGRVRYDQDRTFLVRDRDRRAIAGCPPGLAKKYNGCMPPGQAKKRYDNYRTWNGYDYRPRLFGLKNYSSGRYYYDDGYLLRPASDGGIAGYIPLLGGALAIGNQWPSSYSSHSVPDYYVDYYDLGPRDSYRYADNVIYRVNPSDSAIQSVVALLTGDDFTIGEPMPSGYDVYNVPYPYRDRYNDSDDAWYRYSDGYVYQIDPQTQLISAAIDLLV
ncbi:MAG: hypothetical protein JKY75_08385 [Erythrobacter sp.]|nr:hypothetical protein [Erythrobacter sp.]